MSERGFGQKLRLLGAAVANDALSLQVHLQANAKRNVSGNTG